MNVKTEPAGRLVDILQAAKTKHDQSKVKTVLAEVFNLDETDTESLLRIVADLIQLVYKTKKQIEEMENVNHDLYLKPFTRLELMLSTINLEAHWKSWKNYLDEHTIYGLQFASDQLSRISMVSSIANEEIDHIKNSLQSITDEILDSSIDEDLKLLLIRNLESLRQALLAYKIKGIEGIETELALNIGSIILNKDKLQESAAHNESKSIFKKFSTFLEGVNKTVSTAKKVNEIANDTGITKLLGVD